MAAQRNGPPAFDRMPPQNIEAERSVLGAMLLSSDAVGTVVEMLHENPADVFYLDAHQHVYGAMLALFRKNVPIDPVTLMNQLQAMDVLETSGGASYIAELADAVPTAANVEYYAQIVLDASILRRVIAACTALAAEAYTVQGDVTDLLDRAEQQVFAIAETRQLNPVWRVGDLLEDSIRKIEEVIKSKSGITGLPTGFTDLDEMLSGFQPSDMIILAARPSVGKTAFSLNVAAHAGIREGKAVLIFSLEMAKEQLVQRLLCMEGQINSKRLRTGFLAQSEFPKLQRAADKLSRAPIYIDDTPNINVLDLRSKARRQKAQHDVDLIIIDYLQLMSTGRRAENRQTEIAEISRSIKSLARELRCPVVALSQLSREAEKDDTGVPKLSHLRESGAIEQDADVVLMLSRPPAHEAEGNENLIQVSVAKQRNGPTGVVRMVFEKDVQRFGSLAGGSPGSGPSYAEASMAAEDIIEDDDVPF